MKFRRRAQVLQGQLDMFPVAGVLLLLLLVVLLQSSFVHITGLPIRLSEGEGFPVVTNTPLTVAVDGRGRYYFQSQLVGEEDLRRGFAVAAKRTGGHVTLVLLADRGVTNDVLLRLVGLARSQGIQEAVLAVRPPRLGLPPPEP